MFTAAAITLREAVEAGLVVGILAAMTRVMDRRTAWIGAGILAGLLASGAMALLVGGTARAVDHGVQTVFNAGAMLLAAGVLYWHNLTAGTRGHEVRMAVAKADAATRAGQAPGFFLATVAALAVFREGTETVLLVYGLVASGGRTVFLDTGVGVAAGLATGMALCGLVYAGLVRLPTRWFFGVVNVLMALIAASMAAQAVVLLQRAGVIEMLPGIAWDTSAVLPQAGLPGRALHLLIGYAERPSELQVVVYLGTLTTMALAAWWGHRRGEALRNQTMALPLWRPQPWNPVEDLTPFGRFLALASTGLTWLLVALGIASLVAGTALFVSATRDSDQVTASWLLLAGSLLLILLQTHSWWRATRA